MQKTELKTMVKSNSGRIRIRLRVLIAAKEHRDERKWSYTDINAATGVGTSTLTKWANDEAEYLDRGTLAALCKFFECGPGEVLEYVRDFGLEAGAPPRKRKR